MPKIFITCYQDGPEWFVASALAEDGTGLAGHVCSSRLWVKHDMGLNSRRKHELYEAHYPEGYELVDLVDSTNEELQNNPEYMRALEINHAQGEALDTDEGREGEAQEG